MPKDYNCWNYFFYFSNQRNRLEEALRELISLVIESVPRCGDSEMRKSIRFVCVVFLALIGCTGKSSEPVGEIKPSATTSTLSLPRGISGLELGMAPAEVKSPFKIKQDQDPVAALLIKYGKLEQGEAVAKENESLQKRFFRVSADSGAFPDGVTSADAHSFHNIIYQVGLHYDAVSVKKIGWEGVVTPYLAKYGKPSEDTGSAYLWDDDRTHLEIALSGDIINVFFTDKAIDTEINKAERGKH